MRFESTSPREEARERSRSANTVRSILTGGVGLLAAVSLAACGGTSPTSSATGPRDDPSGLSASASEPSRGNAPTKPSGAGSAGAEQASGSTTDSGGTPETEQDGGGGGGSGTAGGADTDHDRRAAPRCRTGELDASLGRVEGAAGNRAAPLVFTNTSDETCHLRGRPGVTLLDADKEQVGPDAEFTEGNPRVTVRLESGEKASTLLRWSSPVAQPCHPKSEYLRTYPPGAYDALVVPAHIKLCGDTFTVRNLTSGADGIAE